MIMFFKGGLGLENPVDFNGEEIKEGYTLTHCWFDGDYVSFFKDRGVTDIKEIEERVNCPSVIVKVNEKGCFFGEGINDTLYMHDFRFKYAKIVSKAETKVSK